MRTIGFLALGLVLAVVIIFALVPVVWLLGAIATKLGANYPNSSARTQFTCLVMLVALAAGYWLAWMIVM